MTAWPTATRPLVERLGYFAGNDTGDRLRQFSLFDAIRQLDGYAFLDPGHTKQILVSGHGHQLPQRRALPVRPRRLVPDERCRARQRCGGSPPATHSLLLLGYGAFVLATVWAARWVAGHRARGWRGRAGAVRHRCVPRHRGRRPRRSGTASTRRCSACSSPSSPIALLVRYPRLGRSNRPCWSAWH
ncbi:hypothetical protein ACU686_23805 [Yinghuangia aomiensis]